jgi:hypothetical protein
MKKTMVNKKSKPKQEEKLPRALTVFPYQTGRVKDIFADAMRPALEPGKRISINGNIYWESRKNRTDATGKNI